MRGVRTAMCCGSTEAVHFLRRARMGSDRLATVYFVGPGGR